MNLPKINFIGNKQKIVNRICDNVPEDVRSVFDAFSGGTSVSYEFKRRNYAVISNDIMRVNYFLAKGLIENKKVRIDPSDLSILFSGKPIKGFMYKNYSEVLFFPNECMELDQYRKNADRISNVYKKALIFSLLRRAMIRKMPYSRFTIPWDKIVQLRDEEYSYRNYKRKRAYHNKSFKTHILENLDSYNGAIFDNDQKNISYNENVFTILPKIKADLIYIDPPYPGTMNDYHGFYSTIDNYIFSKVAVEAKETFTDKNTSLSLFKKLFSYLSNFKCFILSYNNSSFPSVDDLKNILLKYSKDLKIIEINHSYQITGKDKKRSNREILFVGKVLR